MLYAWSLTTHVECKYTDTCSMSNAHTQTKSCIKGAYLKISFEMFACDQPGLAQLRTSERAKIDLEPAVMEPGIRRNRFNIFKNGLILLTGQWYAPSAVINDAWYCMVLHRIASYCIVLHTIAWYYIILQYLALSCTILHYLLLSCTILH